MEHFNYDDKRIPSYFNIVFTQLWMNDNDNMERGKKVVKSSITVHKEFTV